MYERMLDKQHRPTNMELAAHCGENGDAFARLNAWLSETFLTEQTPEFPYGNRYGWGIAHRRKGRLLCHVFAEADAFTVMLRLTDAQWQQVFDAAQPYMRGCIANKYPCGNGGWVHYRVTREEQLPDIMTALALSCTLTAERGAGMEEKLDIEQRERACVIGGRR